MKICVLAQRVPYPPNKGEKLRTFHHIKRMVELGHQVNVFSFNSCEQDKQDAKQLSTALDIEVQTFPLGPKLLRYSWAILHNLPISVGAFYSANMASAVASKLYDASTDILYLSASSLSYYVFNATKSSSPHCRLIMDFMDVDSDKWKQYAQGASWPLSSVYARESRGIAALERRVNEQFYQTFLIANEEVELFEKEVSSAKPVTVLGNGLDFNAFYPSDKTTSKSGANFLFTGVMDYKPNVDAVLWFVRACWPTIKKALPEAVFTIAGMNPTNDIKALASDPSIKVTGYVDDILPYYHNAGVFVAPFRIARGVQNKVLQASACKVPIVTTSMGAEGILFANNQTMTIADNAEAFSKGCVESVNQHELALSRAQRCFEAIRKHYSWEQQLAPLQMAIAEL